MKKIIFALCILILFSACEKNDPENVARKATLEEIKQNPDFAFWFIPAYNDFNISQSLVQEIKNNFDTEKHSFLIYAEPSCLCGTDYLKFPAFIKVLDSAGISNDFYQIFVVQNEETRHPHSDMFRLQNIPTFIILKEGKFIYSVSDTLLKYNFRTEPNKLEEILLEGLKL
jgi:thioredoxin-related protein